MASQILFRSIRNTAIARSRSFWTKSEVSSCGIILVAWYRWIARGFARMARSDAHFAFVSVQMAEPCLRVFDEIVEPETTARCGGIRYQQRPSAHLGRAAVARTLISSPTRPSAHDSN